MSPKALGTLFVLLVFPVVSSAGDTAGANSAGKNFALQQNANQVVPLIENPNTSGVPHFIGPNVPERHYYGLGEGIEDEAAASASTNPAAQFIYGSRATRPDINLDRHDDPLFTHYNAIRDEATSLTDTYTGCVELPIGDPEQIAGDLRTCNVTRSWRTERAECHTTYRPQCTNDEVFEQPIEQEVTIIVAIEGVNDYGAVIGVDLSNNQWAVQSESGDGESADQFVQLSPITTEGACRDYDTQFEFIGSQDWELAGEAMDAPSADANGEPFTNVSLQVIEHPSCANGMQGQYSLTVSATVEGLSALDTTYAIGGVFQYLVTHSETCPIELVEHRECPLPPSGTDPTLIASTCLESGFREVQGQQVYLECWDQLDIWEVSLLGSEDAAACDALSSEGCGYRGRECVLETEDGVCLEETHTYACQMPTGERAVALCGRQLVCPDGQCTEDVGQEYESAEEDFTEAAAGMTAAGDTAEGFDPELGAFFTGDPKRCTKKSLDFADCCKDRGWGLDLSLDMCSTEEIELGYAREAERALYVGRYTSGGPLDRRRNYVYCTYPSKMSRVLVQQGKAQLGMDFGSAKNPDCSGLTPEMLTALDMNEMDFSSMFPDVLANASGAPSGEELQEIIIDKIDQMFPDN